jgi:hypothetical protein
MYNDGGGRDIVQLAHCITQVHRKKLKGEHTNDMFARVQRIVKTLQQLPDLLVMLVLLYLFDIYIIIHQEVIECNQKLFDQYGCLYFTCTQAHASLPAFATRPSGVLMFPTSRKLVHMFCMYIIAHDSHLVNDSLRICWWDHVYMGLLSLNFVQLVLMRDFSSQMNFPKLHTLCELQLGTIMKNQTDVHLFSDPLFTANSFLALDVYVRKRIILSAEARARALLNLPNKAPINYTLLIERLESLTQNCACGTHSALKAPLQTFHTADILNLP